MRFRTESPNCIVLFQAKPSRQTKHKRVRTNAYHHASCVPVDHSSADSFSIIASISNCFRLSGKFIPGKGISFEFYTSILHRHSLPLQFVQKCPACKLKRLRKLTTHEKRTCFWLKSKLSEARNVIAREARENFWVIFSQNAPLPPQLKNLGGEPIPQFLRAKESLGVWLCSFLDTFLVKKISRKKIFFTKKFF